MHTLEDVDVVLYARASRKNIQSLTLKKANVLDLTCVHLVILLPWRVPAMQRTMSGTGVAADCSLLHPASLPAWNMIPSLSHGGIFCWNSPGIPY